jgi:hypothetical protein
MKPYLRRQPIVAEVGPTAGQRWLHNGLLAATPIGHWLPPARQTTLVFFNLLSIVDGILFHCLPRTLGSGRHYGPPHGHRPSRQHPYMEPIFPSDITNFESSTTMPAPQATISVWLIWLYCFVEHYFLTGCSTRGDYMGAYPGTGRIC